MAPILARNPQRCSPVQAVDELAVRQRDEEGEHGAEMDDEQSWHHRLVTEGEQREPGQGGEA